MFRRNRPKAIFGVPVPSLGDWAPFYERSRYLSHPIRLPDDPDWHFRDSILAELIEDALSSRWIMVQQDDTFMRAMVLHFANGCLSTEFASLGTVTLRTRADRLYQVGPQYGSEVEASVAEVTADPENFRPQMPHVVHLLNRRACELVDADSTSYPVRRCDEQVAEAGLMVVVRVCESRIKGAAVKKDVDAVAFTALALLAAWVDSPFRRAVEEALP